MYRRTQWFWVFMFALLFMTCHFGSAYSQDIKPLANPNSTITTPGVAEKAGNVPHDTADTRVVTTSQPTNSADRVWGMREILIIVPGLFALYFISIFSSKVLQGDVPQIETHWGGFGGGLGGWRMSASLAFLMAAILCGSISISMAWNFLNEPSVSKPATVQKPVNPSHASQQ